MKALRSLITVSVIDVTPITAPTLLKKQDAGATDYQRRSHLLTRVLDDVLDQNRKAG
jgi:hypothetical protein